MTKLKKEQEEHADAVRNEGIDEMKAKKKDKALAEQEVDLEIEDPGAANKVAEEGSLTIQDEKEYLGLKDKLEKARKKPQNKIGKGGQLIELKDPKEFADTMRILVLHDQNTDEKNVKMEKFETKNPTQAKTAAMAMQMTLETNLGAVIIDDGQSGRESLISNFASDQSKLTS